MAVEISSVGEGRTKYRINAGVDSEVAFDVSESTGAVLLETTDGRIRMMNLEDLRGVFGGEAKQTLDKVRAAVTAVQSIRGLQQDEAYEVLTDLLDTLGGIVGFELPTAIRAGVRARRLRDGLETEFVHMGEGRWVSYGFGNFGTPAGFLKDWKVVGLL